MAKDMFEQAKEDVKTFNHYRQKGMGSSSITKLMEVGFWAGAIITVIFMIGAMPFVGPGKAIAGEVWLIISVGGIVMFGGLAMLMRELPEV